jgi:hypothetical protein
MTAASSKSARPATWSGLRIPGKELAEARLQCHHAVQINTRLARGFVPPQADDSHTSLVWYPVVGALIGQPVDQFRLGLRIADLTLVLLESAGDVVAEFPLDGRTVAEATNWLGKQLTSIGHEPAPLADPLHFELDDHPLIHGAQFEFRGREALFEDLAKWYGNAALCLSSISAPVRCWPHHFDIAAQIAAGEHSIGVGLSPGDRSYSQPYFYVTPWPYADASLLPELSTGSWHTEGWVGAVLIADEILPKLDQQRFVRRFFDRAIAALEEARKEAVRRSTKDALSM